MRHPTRWFALLAVLVMLALVADSLSSCYP